MTFFENFDNNWDSISMGKEVEVMVNVKSCKLVLSDLTIGYVKNFILL